MPKKPSDAQRKRAAGLRKLIGELASGPPPFGAPPKTPRERTDEAARRKWLREKKRKA
jgi:hypothetical protein